MLEPEVLEILKKPGKDWDERENRIIANLLKEARKTKSEDSMREKLKKARSEVYSKAS